MNIAVLEMSNRIFGLDPQLVADVIVNMAAVFVLFILLSYLLFKPARELMKKRQDYIQGQLDEAAAATVQADERKEKYEQKLSNADWEAEQLLASARRKAVKKRTEIVNVAKDEAARITARANKEIELEKVRVQDEVKQEIVNVATAMASRFVEESLDEEKQVALIDETLGKMGDNTWQN